jgi:bacteriocin biosynthesis cyclodehydratase domain-containing protein
LNSPKNSPARLTAIKEDKGISEMIPSSQKLKCLPVQIIQSGNRVILKRGRTEIKIEGDGAGEALQAILGATVTDEGATREELCARFAAPDRPTVESLITHLTDKKILVPADEGVVEFDAVEPSIDIFYWHFGHPAERITEQLNEKGIVILGVNCISRQLATSFIDSGITRFTVVDYPLLRNLRLFEGGAAPAPASWPAAARGLIKDYGEWADSADPAGLHCLIGTADFAGQEFLRPWNEFCIEHNLHFLPVTLNDLVGYVGPLVIPGQTSCLECLLARQNSHLFHANARREVAEQAFAGQGVTGFHPSMASILGDVAAIELCKLYGGLPEWHVGALIEVNLLAGRMKPRRVLRVPRCPVCSSLIRHSSVSPKIAPLMPGNYSDVHRNESPQ